MRFPILSTLFAFTQIAIAHGAAHPMSPLTLVNRDDVYVNRLDERPPHRVLVVVVCILFAVVLALAQGYRAGRLAGQKSKTRVSDVLVFAQGFVCTAFLFATAIQVSGLGLQTDGQCHAAIRVCIVMYGADKIALYLFLLERVHIVRAPFVDRTRDRLYVIGAILTTGGFFAIMAWQFVNPFSELNHQTGICRIGIEPQAAMAVIVLDILINTILTGIFVWQLRPALGSAAPKMRSLASNTTCVESDSPSHGLRQWMGKTRHSMRTSSRSDLRAMLVRNVVGSGFMLMVTVCNNSLFLSWAFAKMSHACLLMCLTDICLGMLVTQWLTMRSAEPEVIRPSQVSVSGERTDSMLLVNEKPVHISRVVDQARFNPR
ncbi:hypothetical protein AA0119_g12353 [Alternaria tenuissima]|uniref:G-protein coupled receptors family 3 profile domain-containing protein n=1 Tax=Alternaria tenuissima TaxID=119927 RepID=A0ABY0FRI6_9PLEO|nr:hypothetical protein AA0119_g12353 [Alternaria tenuissima]